MQQDLLNWQPLWSQSDSRAEGEVLSFVTLDSVTQNNIFKKCELQLFSDATLGYFVIVW